MTADSPTPRRKRHFLRWLIVIFVLLIAWAGWRVNSFRSALEKAKELGWVVDYTSPSDVIRQDWKAAFRKDTWLDGVTYLEIRANAGLDQHLDIVHQLNPSRLVIYDSSTLRDLSSLTPLSRLYMLLLIDCPSLTNIEALKRLPSLIQVTLYKCPALTNVDTLKHLSALEYLVLTGCTGLTNIDAVKQLPALHTVEINGCTGLTKETIAALKAALPNAIINHD